VVTFLSLYEHRHGAVLSPTHRSPGKLSAHLFYSYFLPRRKTSHIYKESAQEADSLILGTPAKKTTNAPYTTVPRVNRFQPHPMSGYQRSGEYSRSHEEDWRNIEDQTERRRIQNRLAQRKYRKCTNRTWTHSFPDQSILGDLQKQKRDDEARVAENQQVAGSAYAAPEAKDLARNANPAGLPWGSVSLKHVVETGKAKQERAQQASREGSAGPVYSRQGTQG
jgi:hypothetical protein